MRTERLTSKQPIANRPVSRSTGAAKPSSSIPRRKPESASDDFEAHRADVAAAKRANTATPAKPLPPMSGAAALAETREAFFRGLLKSREKAVAELTSLRALPKPRNAKVALQHYDTMNLHLGAAHRRANAAMSLHPDPELRAAAEACLPLLGALASNEELLEILSELDASKENPETQKLLADTVEGFQRSGMMLPAEKRAELQQLSSELAKLSRQFSKNLTLPRRVTFTKEELEGLPESFFDAHLPDANGVWRLAPSRSALVDVLTHAMREETREKMWQAFRNRGFPENEAVLQALLEKRHAKAQLLGFRSWAEYTTQTNMVGGAENAADFIQSWSDAIFPNGRTEYAELLRVKQQGAPGAARVAPWDVEFLQRRLKTQGGNFDLEELKPYLSYETARAGVLDVTARLFGISYRKAEVKTWHPDVEVYDLLDGDRILGRVHLDPFARDNKHGTACLMSLVEGKRGEQLPEAVVVCNFTKAATGPSLLSFDDLIVLFHEWGHLLHEIFSGQTEWAAHSGTATEWDFVEVPSTLMEAWPENGDILRTFARHHQTGEPMPDALVEGFKARPADSTLRKQTQALYSALSLELHRRDPSTFEPAALLAELAPRHTAVDIAAGDKFPYSFAHLMGHGATYYNYEWSRAMAKEIGVQFDEAGMFNRDLARKLRTTILSAGGTKPARELMEDFLGRPVDPARAYAA